VKRKTKVQRRWQDDTLRNMWIWSTPQDRQFTCWEALFEQTDPHDFMTPEENRIFERMPEEITVYRGFQNGAREGYSWSVVREVAEVFAAYDPRFPKGEVIERRVKKSEVYALILDEDENNANEYEIILRKVDRSVLGIEPIS
jgi:hypothetical protein